MYLRKEVGYSDRRAVYGKICEVAKWNRERGEEINQIKQNQHLGQHSSNQQTYARDAILTQ